MKCNNRITIACYANGKETIEGSESIMKERIEKYKLDMKINGYYKHQECNGQIQCAIYSESPKMGNDCGEVVIEFRCSKCGINHGELLSILDVERIVDFYIKEK